MTDLSQTHLLPAATLAALQDQRTRCEVWTRVMGYHRPVASFNVGKKGEHRERLPFQEQAARISSWADQAL